MPCSYKPDKAAPAPAWPSWQPPEPQGQSRPRRDWPEFGSEGRDRVAVFDNGLGAGWWSESYNAWVQPQADAAASGLRKGQGFCAKVSQQGGVRFKTKPGAFSGKYKVREGLRGWEGLYFPLLTSFPTKPAAPPTPPTTKPIAITHTTHTPHTLHDTHLKQHQQHRNSSTSGSTSA